MVTVTTPHKSSVTFYIQYHHLVLSLYIRVNESGTLPPTDDIMWMVTKTITIRECDSNHMIIFVLRANRHTPMLKFNPEY